MTNIQAAFLLRALLSLFTASAAFFSRSLMLLFFIVLAAFSSKALTSSFSTVSAIYLTRVQLLLNFQAIIQAAFLSRAVFSRTSLSQFLIIQITCLFTKI